MPKLVAPKEDVKRFMLPTTKHLPEAEQAWADLNVGKLITDDLAGADAEGGMIRMSAAVLASRIKGWNFTTEDGVTPVPVTPQTVRLLDWEDFQYLNEQFDNTLNTGMSDSQKKS